MYGLGAPTLEPTLPAWRDRLCVRGEGREPRPPHMAGTSHLRVSRTCPARARSRRYVCAAEASTRLDVEPRPPRHAGSRPARAPDPSAGRSAEGTAGSKL